MVSQEELSEDEVCVLGESRQMLLDRECPAIAGEANVAEKVRVQA